MFIVLLSLNFALENDDDPPVHSNLVLSEDS